MKLSDMFPQLKVRWRKNAADVYTVEKVRAADVIISNVHGHEVRAEPQDVWPYVEAK